MAQKVNIKYSCDKKWCSMAEVEAGVRHCDSCDLNIKDFSSDKHPNVEGVYCGRFCLGQVGQINSQLTFNSLATLTMSLVGLLNLTSAPVSAQNQSDPETKQVHKKNHGRIVISGMVKDKKNNAPIPFVNVELLSSGKQVTGCTTNFDGEFKLTNIDTNTFPLDNLELVFSSVGFRKDTIKAVNIPEEFVGMDMVIDMATIVESRCISIRSYTTTGLIAIQPDTTKRNNLPRTTPPIKTGRDK